MSVINYLIRDADRADLIIGRLSYNKNTKRFSITVEPNLPADCPIMFSMATRRKLTEFPQSWVDTWINERIIPPTRQNISDILKSAGLKVYDEYGMLMFTQGRCAQDNCYLEEVMSECKSTSYFI